MTWCKNCSNWVDEKDTICSNCGKDPNKIIKSEPIKSDTKAQNSTVVPFVYVNWAFIFSIVLLTYYFIFSTAGAPFGLYLLIFIILTYYIKKLNKPALTIYLTLKFIEFWIVFLIVYSNPIGIILIPIEGILFAWGYKLRKYMKGSGLMVRIGLFSGD